MTGVRVMVFNATFNNISVMEVSFMGGGNQSTRREKNHRPTANKGQTLSHNIVSNTPRLSGIRTHNVRR